MSIDSNACVGCPISRSHELAAGRCFVGPCHLGRSIRIIRRCIISIVSDGSETRLCAKFKRWIVCQRHLWHLVLVLLFLLTPLAGCQSESDPEPVSVDQPAAISPDATPDRESGSPYGQSSEVNDRVDSQNADAGNALPPFPPSGQRDVAGPQPVDAGSPNFNVDPNRPEGDATAAA